ncbi:hypothetical protein [Bradyrhizobium elkanii]|uniref:hypothetical protein n=1 Tax=Bradyrhizobium elkanii TaxID=29448 RepID=UPI0002E3D6B4|nr:hypothetical protein [Bradyrhizobium elkanii]MCP1750251.1 hypothetical protein [Bradyrhizobium elkanii]MCS3693220.1 hypothetical protein [Bradyrhizobium elkanii]MCS3889457.1 hypothetical protein [Bradyrhizobium elkanii]MCS4211522.1 hypothetical protein [Bradyrhizobium elkanii]WLB12762.1 hypothetical protein QIH87_17645 [Bradyrhizobium elkanii]
MDSNSIPIFDVDRFSDEALREPYSIYAALRVVRIRDPDVYAIGSFIECKMRCEQTTFC